MAGKPSKYLYPEGLEVYRRTPTVFKFDLIDWIRIGVEDRVRECNENGDWFSTEEGQMPEVLVYTMSSQLRNRVNRNPPDKLAQFPCRK